MNVFDLRDKLTSDYADYIGSFIQIRDERVRKLVDDEISRGLLWPEPLIQLNPAFEPGLSIDALVREAVLHPTCERVFRLRKRETGGQGKELRLHKHQEQAIRIAQRGHDYVLTTGTGSGKSLSYIVPIVDHVLRNGSGRGIQAIIVYPMNALANSQALELEKFLCDGFPDRKGPVSFARYTGQENDEHRQRIAANPPDIILTNYVMLELILTRVTERALVQAAQGLRFLVIDELHTYRGRQGADVAMLVRRTREALDARDLQCVGTSATLAGEGTQEQQRAEVAQVASQLFGTTVDAAHVIGETLRRSTAPRNSEDPVFLKDLPDRIANPHHQPPREFSSFTSDPLSSWIESCFGLAEEQGTGRLVRARPRSIAGDGGAASALAELTGVDAARCAVVVREALLGGYRCEPNPVTGFPAFAFRLHQFISRGDTVYASLESERERTLTARPQQFVPNSDRQKVFLPLVFCRECGQEYYCVWEENTARLGERLFVPRDLYDMQDPEGREPVYIYHSTSRPWPTDAGEVQQRVPGEWLEERNGQSRIKRSRQKDLPQNVRLSAEGRTSNDGIEGVVVPAPFRFCLCCGVSYDIRQRADFAKLTSLGSEGRSTATTILSLSALRRLRSEPDLPDRARKLLSFTDNRQDASLQAGHLNDFVEIGLLRAALYKAANQAGTGGLRHEELAQKVYDALGLSLEHFAVDPAVRFQAEQETKRAFRNVLGYRLYRDLQRGWRITSPNLEQAGLLEIRYLSLDELCASEPDWRPLHPALASASPKTRASVAKVLLDFMRRELAIKVDYLETTFQERLVQQSSQRLADPWGIDENERLEHASILLPRSRSDEDYGGYTYLSARGGFGLYLRRRATFPEFDQALSLDDVEHVIDDLLAALKVAGLVTVVMEPKGEETKPGYQLVADAMVWIAGDGSLGFRDPIRVPSAPASGSQTNKFFIQLYTDIASQLLGLRAAEHTAQVPSETRQEREDAFRDARLPILFCSPTMELGVDISELNVVNMRNIPPTPANYAQRSGRAGRSGQPALVFSYCTTGSPHDQYFFRRPQRMVAGAVSPPRLDLCNEDLLRAHVQAIWLTESGLSLGSSLQDILDLSGDSPSLELLDGIKSAFEYADAKARARFHAVRVLKTIQDELQESGWYTDDWLDRVLSSLRLEFNRACDRWRGLYRAARAQAAAQNRIANDAARSADDRQKARRLRQEAESQLDLLIKSESVLQSDFYSYRYFASEGFLPGYNFPRLPISAYLPGRKSADEFLSRPRFLAISEFGPRALVYHEGSRYLINKVILPPRDEGRADQLPTQRAKLCDACGYLNPVNASGGPDLCERCLAKLPPPLLQLFRLQNVSTKRRDKISSDEEERMRLGFEIKTAMRFSEKDGHVLSRTAVITLGNETLAKLSYGQTARLWRINYGWTRRKVKEDLGFVIDIERGYWERNEQSAEDDPEDPMSPRKTKVIPFVEDDRNCLLYEPGTRLDSATMASLQAVLKNAIQIIFQLEDSELAAEPLPDRDNRRTILLYEAAEGGAGILRRLVTEPDAVRRIAREGLLLCHFDPNTGEDQRRAEHSTEDCEAACYDCLMSYGNQRDHRLLDRQKLKELLLDLAKAEVRVAPATGSASEHLAGLMRQAGSELEKKWLSWLNEGKCHLPSHAQRRIDAANTRPDFLYAEQHVAVYVDGPPHEFPERQARDATQTANLEDLGFTVLRFRDESGWKPIVERYPNVFGRDGRSG